jgi:hypothetical protein
MYDHFSQFGPRGAVVVTVEHTHVVQITFPMHLVHA